MFIIHQPESTDHKAWHEFLDNHPQNIVFQSPEMHNFYLKVNKFEPVSFLVKVENTIVGVLVAVIIREYKAPLGFLSSRAVIYGGPVVSRDIPQRTEVLSILLSALVKKVKKKTLFIQFRNFFAWNDKETAVFESYGFTFRERINLLIDTISPQQIIAGMKENRRRQVLKGIKQGNEIRPPASLNEVKQFYELLVNLYKYKVRKPLPSWSFFEQFFSLSAEGKLGFIRVIVKNKEIIGGILCPVTSGKTVFEWYVVGFDKEFPGQYPSVLATWSAMKYAADNKLKQFDLMGLGKLDEPYGVRDFKLRFGGEIVNFGRFGRRNYQHLYNFVEFAYNMLRYLKRI